MSQAQGVHRHRSALQGNNNAGLEAKYKTERQHLMLKKQKRSSKKKKQKEQKENKQHGS
jgi:hypothetical protein